MLHDAPSSPISRWVDSSVSGGWYHIFPSLASRHGRPRVDIRVEDLGGMEGSRSDTCAESLREAEGISRVPREQQCHQRTPHDDAVGEPTDLGGLRGRADPDPYEQWAV